MKYLIFYIIILLSCTVIHAQQDSFSIEVKTSKKIHYGVSVSQSVTSYSTPTSLLFTTNWKKHQLDLGVQYSFFDFYFWEVPKRNIGVELNYRFYSKTDSTLFCASPFFTTNYYYTHHEQLGVYWDPDKPDFHNKPTIMEYNNHYFAVNLGYGIKFRLSKRFYVGSCLGLGVVWEFEKRDRFFQNGDLIYEGKSIDKSFNGLILLYFGYNF